MPARILVASADKAVSASAETGLRRGGHDLLIAAQGGDALRSVSAMPPDLLVIDAALPGIDGFEVVRRIRRTEDGRSHTPVVLIGPLAMESKIEGLRAGADDYVAKPVNAQELAARVRALLARFGQAEQPAVTGRSAPGRLHAYYGAKGGVGTTTLAINSAIALHREAKASVALVDGNLQFGDHRVFLDMSADKHSIVDAVTATDMDAELVRRLVVRHESGVDLMLAPVTPEAAELVSAEQHHLLKVVDVLRQLYDHVVVDLDQRLDDHALDIIGAADVLMVVLTADLSCLKNVRMLLDTMNQIGVPKERMSLVLNRNKAFTGISIKSVESVLRRPIEHQVVNDYRTAMSSLNAGTPFMLDNPDSLIGRDVVALARAMGREDRPGHAPSVKRLLAVPGRAG